MKIGDSLLAWMSRKGLVNATVIDIINTDNGAYLIIYSCNKLHKFFMFKKSKDTIKEDRKNIKYISTYQGLYTPNLY